MSEIGIIAVAVENITDSKSRSLISDAGKLRFEDGREIEIKLSGGHIEYWFRIDGATHRFKVSLAELTAQVAELLWEHLDLEYVRPE